jgi:hypothetical protein
MSNPIDELLSRPIPKKLWHYTSIQGFQAIVASKSVWATDVRFLNDREEFIHSRKIADEILAQTPELDEAGFLHKEFLDKAVMLGLDSGPMANLQVFVACFSSSEDQLGQWRGYSHGSSGVSLGFDLSSFRPPANSDTLVCFAPCTYDAIKKRELLLDALRHVKDEIVVYREKIFALVCELEPDKSTAANKEMVVKKFLDANPQLRAPVEEFLAAVVKTRVDCFRAAALLKNEAFAEENEWRLVLPMLPDEVATAKNPPRFRVGKTTLIPYIAHPFSVNAANAGLPIVDIILGPGSDENSVFAAQRFLKSAGLTITPRLSKVPYRAS